MQCISCLYTNTYKQSKGKGLCDKTGKLFALLDVHECKNWNLAAMDMVKCRTVRKIVFDDKGIGRLK